MAPGMLSLQMALEAAASTTEITLLGELGFGVAPSAAAAAAGADPRGVSNLSLL
jgi:hypothetical protein